MLPVLRRLAVPNYSKYMVTIGRVTLCKPNVTSYCSNSMSLSAMVGNARCVHVYHTPGVTISWNKVNAGWCKSSNTSSASFPEQLSRTFSETSWLKIIRESPLSCRQTEYSCDKVKSEAQGNFCIVPNFISDQEESVLLKEIDRHFRGIRYEYDHWDNAIHGFRETEKSKWSPETEGILQRVRDAAFSSEAKQLPLVHVLDLAENGYIKAHVDSVKFCGPTIAGLSLISPSVLRLVKENDSSLWMKAVLPAGSLYIMRNQIRFDYTHEILKDEESFIKGERVKRGRRVSVMFRDQPSDVLQS